MLLLLPAQEILLFGGDVVVVKVNDLLLLCSSEDPNGVISWHISIPGTPVGKGSVGVEGDKKVLSI